MSLKRSRLDDAIIDDDNEEKGVTLRLDEQDSNKPEEEIQLMKKKRVNRKKITEGDIAGPDGIQRIYEDFPSVRRFRGRGMLRAATIINCYISDYHVV